LLFVAVPVVYSQNVPCKQKIYAPRENTYKKYVQINFAKRTRMM